MTVTQASQILGMPPTDTSSVLVQWRRGNAQEYNGTPAGAIEFHVLNDRIVDVPEGGIFSPAALAKINADWLRKRQKSDAELEKLGAEQLEIARLAAEARRKQEKQEEEEALKSIAAELKAKENAIVICKDKATCSKVFALAQIYVQQNADQKIQVATDTIIETYNPTEGGKAAITVIKMPRSGSTEMVQITPSCKADKYFEKICQMKRITIYQGFKPFIEDSLSR